MLAECSGSPLTSEAIIKMTIGIYVEGLDEEDKERVWIEEAEMCDARGNLETARAIFNYLIEYFKSKKKVWIKAIEFERKCIKNEISEGS